VWAGFAVRAAIEDMVWRDAALRGPTQTHPAYPQEAVINLVLNISKIIRLLHTYRMMLGELTTTWCQLCIVQNIRMIF
jgi:hypothetical protein